MGVRLQNGITFPAEHLHDWPVAERSAIMLYVRTDVNKALSKALPAPAVYSVIELHPAPLNHFCVCCSSQCADESTLV